MARGLIGISFKKSLLLMLVTMAWVQTTSMVCSTKTPEDDQSSAPDLWKYYGDDQFNKLSTDTYKVDVPIPFPYFETSYRTIQVYKNGLLSFGPNQLADFSKPLGKGTWPSYPPLFSVFWADMDFSETGGVWTYEAKGRLINATADAELLKRVEDAVGDNFFKPLWALVVTWTGAQTPDLKYQNGSFQAILSTDGLNSYAILRYKEVWTNLEFADGPIVSFGYSRENGAYNESKTTPSSGTYPSPIQLVGGYAERNSNFKCVESVQASKENLGDKLEKLPVCPCLQIQAERDLTFRQDGSSNSCFQSLIPTDDVFQSCCYSEFGVLIMNREGAGIPQKLNNTYDFCCEGANKSLCSTIFFKTFPTSDCKAYAPPNTVVGFGDPHITTLDGALYTLNGIAEYTLLKIDDNDGPLQIQIRSEISDANDTNTNSTKFTAMALKFTKDENVYEIFTDADGKTVSDYWTPSKPVKGEGALWFTYKTSKGEIIIVLPPSGISMKISASNSVLRYTIAFPKSIPTKGLLGNNDGKEDNDFEMSNGTTIDANTLTPEQLNEFVESWRVTNASDSLFSYTKPNNDTFDDYYDALYEAPLIPTTVNGVLDELDSDQQKEANKTCGQILFCLQDYFLTRSKESAAKVREAFEQIEKEKNELNVTLIDFKDLPEQIYITESKPANVSLNVDPEDEKAVFGLTLDQTLSSLSGGKPLIEGKAFQWSIPKSFNDLRHESFPLTLTLQATSGLAKTEVNPFISLCLCEEEVQCQEISNRPSSAQSGNVFAVPCSCNDPFKKGRYCDEQYEVCQDCYDRTKCNTTKIDYCSECPAGKDGDGFICREINDCLVAGCEYQCVDGSDAFTCICPDGYALKADNKTCEDVNECENRQADCPTNGFCENIPGSYRCECNPGLAGVNCTFQVGASFIGWLGMEKNNDQQWSQALTIKSSDEFKTLADKVQTAVETRLGQGNNFQDITFLVEVIEFKEYNLNDGFAGAVKAGIAAAAAATDDDGGSEGGTTQQTTEAPVETGIGCTFVIYSSSKNITQQNIYNLFYIESCDPRCSFHNILLAKNGTPEVQPESALCDYEVTNRCDALSTTCSAQENEIVCLCKTGLRKHPLSSIYGCIDIDECEYAPSTCESCRNTFGSYICQCGAGEVWNTESHKCEDNACGSNPCHNGGECVYLERNPGFVCRCSSEYSGERCDEKAEDYAHLKIILIVVGVALGFLCLALFVILLVICCKNKRSEEDSEPLYSEIKRDPSRKIDYNEFKGLPRPRLNEESPPEMTEILDYTQRHSQQSSASGSRPPSHLRAFKNSAYELDHL